MHRQSTGYFDKVLHLLDVVNPEVSHRSTVIHTYVVKPLTSQAADRLELIYTTCTTFSV